MADAPLKFLAEVYGSLGSKGVDWPLKALAEVDALGVGHRLLIVCSTWAGIRLGPPKRIFKI
jgi:hypothetical protein